MRIGLFGGSFNPIHKAHIWIAEYALEHLNLDEVIFIPCYRSVDKQMEEYIDSDHRINMIKLVLFDKCSLSLYEMERREGIETIETLRYFRDKYPKDELFFIIGLDNLLTIDTWQEYREIDKLVNLVVFNRDCQVSKIDSKGLEIILMNNDFWNISSSSVRESKDFSQLDERVSEYIKENGLYNV